jgi:hypothetical protein
MPCGAGNLAGKPALKPASIVSGGATVRKPVVPTMRFALLLLWTPVIAQSLRVYSEFAQINAKGEVTAPAEPREILSPAIVRNGFTSFQIVVQVESETPYRFHIGENPEHAVRVTLYRESGEKLEPVELPYEGTSTQVFWMDLWTDRDAPVRRIKIEPQLTTANLKGDWIIYPMEVRVMDAAIQGGRSSSNNETPLCAPNAKSSEEPTISGMHLRNWRQDTALTRQFPEAGVSRMKAICETPPPPANPEWYFKIRDYLFRLR